MIAGPEPSSMITVSACWRVCVTNAARQSPYYADQHRGMQRAALSQLPPLTKTQLMAQWDRLVTSPELRLDSVTRRLQDLESGGGDPGQPWQSRWWTAATAGSAGQRGVFVWNRREWSPHPLVLRPRQRLGPGDGV